MKIFSNFAAVSDQETNIKIVSGCFYVLLVAIVCKDIRLFKSLFLLQSCNSSLGRDGRRIAFLIILIFHRTMTKRMKNYSGVKYSTTTVTPDCESVNLPAKRILFPVKKNCNELLVLANTNNSIVIQKDVWDLIKSQAETIKSQLETIVFLTYLLNGKQKPVMTINRSFKLEFNKGGVL